MDEAKLAEIFSTVLQIPIEEVNDSLEYNKAKSWDSVAHMVLVGKIDDTFGIMLDTEDIINMSTYGKAKEILKKYGVALS